MNELKVEVNLSMEKFVSEKSEKKPLVSIIMPCYNDGEYIQEAINSVMSQTYQSIELVIINDGSTDLATIKIISSLDDPRIKVLNSENLRPAGARNKGIESANGKYILPVDSDDIIDSTYIEKAVKIIENDEEIGVVYCQADLFGLRTGRWDLPNYSFDKMLLDNIVFVTALFRKSDWEKIGGFSVEMDAGMEDYDFWISILELGKSIHQIPEVLFHYRIKKESRTTRFKKSTEAIQETYHKIYLRHPVFYEKYHKEHAIELRKALIEHIAMCEALKNSVDIYNRLVSIPGLKWFVRKFIIK